MLNSKALKMAREVRDLDKTELLNLHRVVINYRTSTDGERTHHLAKLVTALEQSIGDDHWDGLFASILSEVVRRSPADKDCETALIKSINDLKRFQTQ